MDKLVNLSTRNLYIILPCAVILLFPLLAFIFFPRPSLPSRVAEDRCSGYHIRLDGTSIEAIYLAPETILADPTAFLQGDPAYRLLGEHRTRVHDPFSREGWIADIRALARQPLAQREQRAPYRLYQLIMDNQHSFCQQVVSNVMAYLPEETDAEVTIGASPHLAIKERGSTLWVQPWR